MGDKTQPCGTPVFMIMLVDLLPLTVTCCDLSCRKSQIHLTSAGLTCSSVRQSNKVFVLTVLKAEEKCINKILEHE